MLRLSEVDCLMARIDDATGVTGIQTVWIFDEPLDRAGLERFHTALAAGRLARVAVRPTIPAAGDWWSANAEIAPLHIDTTALRREDISTWLCQRGRDRVSPYGGPA